MAVRIYMDQSVYGHMLDAALNWRDGSLAKSLLDATGSGDAEVWIGPTNLVELAQATDPTRRTDLANIMLELSASRRVWQGSQFQVIEEFLNTLNGLLPGAIGYRQYFDARVASARRVCLGAFALLALGREAEIDTLSFLNRRKLENSLLATRFALDPQGWLDRVTSCVAGTLTTTANVYADMDQLSLHELEEQVQAAEQSVTGLDAATLKKLNSDRNRISRSYGAIEVGSFLEETFVLPMELDLLFDIPHIVANWESLQHQLGTTLPPDIPRDSSDALLAIPNITTRILTIVLASFAKGGLATTTTMYDALLWELQKSVNDQKLPTRGLCFDVDHVTSMWCFPVFVTKDGQLAGTARTISQSISRETGKKWRPAVVQNPKQLKKAITDAEAMLESD